MKSAKSIEWLALVVITCAILAVKFGVHEMWKDEWQAWFVSRDLGFIDMLGFLYYEGHPALWYVYLKPFTWLFEDGEIGLKLAHSFAVIGTVFLLYKIDTNRWAKLLFLLSYAFMFEYGVISRGYILVIALSLAIAHRLKSEDLNRWTLPILLFLLCQSEVQGVILGGAFVLILIWEHRHSIIKVLRPVGAYIIGLLVFVVTVYPRKDADELAHAYSDQWSFGATFQGLTTNAIWPGVLPDTNVFGPQVLGIILGGILLSGIAFFLKKNRGSILFFSGYWLATWSFHLLFYNGGLRQWSMVPIALFIAFALIEKNKFERRHLLGFIILFLPSIFYNGKAVWRDVQLPFSNAKSAGLFIRDKVPENVPIIAINKFENTPVVGYAGRPFNALPDGQPFTYFKWVEKVYLPAEQELNLFAEYKGVGGIVIVAPYTLDAQRYPNLKEWKRFDRFNLKKENYIIYLYDRR